MKGLNNMRKNSARKWLHFTLDLLPLIAIPVFMVYAHRHSLTERTNVEINYRYETNEVNSLDDLVAGNVYQLDNFDFKLDDSSYSFSLHIYSYDNFDYSIGNVSEEYVDETAFDVLDYSDFNLFFNFTCTDSANSFLGCYTNQNCYVAYDVVYELDDNSVGDTLFSFENIVFSIDTVDNMSIPYFKLYYGGLIENYDYSLPSATDFNVIESVNADTSNENIMNVFYNDFCVATEKYFNFDNVFNFGDIWNWFETNMFGGNAPVIAHAIYEIIVYELIMDIMFLSYAVFMFIIDFAEDTLARFTGWSSRG